jgi:exodeoxyribonuclease VII small subunit
MSPRKGSAKGDSIRYAEAMAELERILEDLENDQIDVDELVSRVRRASELIRLCRERLGRSQAEIEQVVAELEDLEQDSPAAGDDGADEEDEAAH